MSVYLPDPDCNCCFCYHAQRKSGDGIEIDDTKELYCPVKKCHIDYDHSVQCGTECEDREINPNWVAISHALKVGREYQRTGNIRVFL
jgi:hypothetical protein